MKRKYNRDLFRGIVEKINKKVPHAFIGVDLIVGFPGETAEDFEDSLDFIRSINISALHVFPYSRRKGTPANDDPDQVQFQEKEIRKKRALELSELKKRELYALFAGKKASVLIERVTSDGVADGFTENYIPVFIENTGKSIRNTIVDVLLGTEYNNERIKAELI